MRSATLNRRITIQRAVISKGASGGKNKSWLDVVSLYASIRNLSGNERRATSHGGEVAQARTEFMVRFVSGISESMRVLYGGKMFDITHVNNLKEQNRWLILTCDTGVNNG